MTTIRHHIAEAVIEGWIPLSRNNRDKSLRNRQGWRIARDKQTVMEAFGPCPFNLRPEGKRLVEIFISRAGSPSDDDNRVARAKDVLDALKQARWITDDSPEFCAVEVVEERGPKFTRVTIVEVIEAAEPPGKEHASCTSN